MALDDIDLASERPESRNAKAPKIPSPGRPGLRIGWLLALLFATVAAALGALLIEGRMAERAELSRSRDEAAQLRRQLFVVQDDRQKALKRLAAQKDADAQAVAALKLDAKFADLSREGHSIVVHFADEVLFGAGEADLSARGKEALGKLATNYKTLKDVDLVVGTRRVLAPPTWELTATRAIKIARYLTETAGLDAKHLSVEVQE